MLLCFLIFIVLSDNLAAFQSSVWEKHHDNHALFEILQSVSSNCPEISHLYNLKTGRNDKTPRGNKLWVLSLGKFPKIHMPNIPEFKFIANMHGNEVVGREILLRLASYMCEQYLKGDAYMQQLIESARIHLMPSMNPDGWDIATAMFNHSGGRENANGVDLNRNFPNLDFKAFEHMKYGGSLDHLKSGEVEMIEPETKMIMKWLDDIPFVLSANMHGGDLVANYPYDTSIDNTQSLSNTPDHPLFVSLAKSYSEYHPRMASGLKDCGIDDTPFHDGITNGAKWYPINGSMQDYNYLATNTFELTLELGCNKYPPATMLNDYWEENKEAMLNFIMQVHRGVKGQVFTHGSRGLEPVANALVKVVNITDPENPVAILHNVRTAEEGDYYRLLMPGSYAIIVEAPGYLKAVACVRTNDELPSLTNNIFKATTKNIVLDPDNVEEKTTDTGDYQATLQALKRGPFGNRLDPSCREFLSGGGHWESTWQTLFD